MIGRLVRTVVRLHPVQIAARAPHALVARSLRDVPSAGAPRVRSGWPPATEATRRFAAAERARGDARLARLPAVDRLRAYEASYGLELGPGDDAPLADWSSPVAVEPYPASVRARRIAVAIRCGRRDLGPELARAARAVLLQPEIHLLGNHLLENGLALVCAGAVAEGAEANAWWTIGARLLGSQLAAQFLEDGGHVERSASYHLALAAGLLEALELVFASGRRAPQAWRDTAARALGWARAVRAPDGTYPLFNDAALDAAPAVDDVLALGASMDIAPANVTTGVSGAGSGPSVVRLEPTGWLRLDAGNGSCVFVDAGPDAAGWQPGHAHADGLTIEAWIAGVRTIVDFGVASYVPGQARDATRATASHNTVEVAGADSCEVWGAFRVGRRGRGRVVQSDARDGARSVALEHDGYRWMRGSPHHLRRLELGPDYLSIEDRVQGGAAYWASRLRFDAQAFGAVRVSGDGPIATHEGSWYPLHGEGRPAVVLEQRARASAGPGVRWLVQW
jgi:hypothetical protein